MLLTVSYPPLRRAQGWGTHLVGALGKTKSLSHPPPSENYLFTCWSFSTIPSSISSTWILAPEVLPSLHIRNGAEHPSGFDTCRSSALEATWPCTALETQGPLRQAQGGLSTRALSRRLDAPSLGMTNRCAGAFGTLLPHPAINPGTVGDGVAAGLKARSTHLRRAVHEQPGFSGIAVFEDWLGGQYGILGAKISFRRYFQSWRKSKISRKAIFALDNLRLGERWWRRRESNPRPQMLLVKRLHA
jgi:hypothetical protein